MAIWLDRVETKTVRDYSFHVLASQSLINICIYVSVFVSILVTIHTMSLFGLGSRYFFPFPLVGHLILNPLVFISHSHFQSLLLLRLSLNVLMLCVMASDELMINEMNGSFLSPLLKLDTLGIANHLFVFIYVLLLNLGFDLSFFSFCWNWLALTEETRRHSGPRRMLLQEVRLVASLVLSSCYYASSQRNGWM